MDDNTLAQGGVRNILTEDEEEGQVELECADELKRYREEGNLTVFVNAPEVAGTLFYINDNLEWYERQQ
jgi:hypothetical protein